MSMAARLLWELTKFMIVLMIFLIFLIWFVVPAVQVYLPHSTVAGFQLADIGLEHKVMLTVIIGITIILLAFSHPSIVRKR